jgi:hypothetical protein
MRRMNIIAVIILTEGIAFVAWMKCFWDSEIRNAVGRYLESQIYAGRKHFSYYF